MTVISVLETYCRLQRHCNNIRVMMMMMMMMLMMMLMMMTK